MHGGVSGDLKEGGAFMYGTGGELPGGDAIVPNGMKSLVDSMLANTQVYFGILGDMAIFFNVFRTACQHADMSRRITLFGLLTWTRCIFKGTVS